MIFLSTLTHLPLDKMVAKLQMMTSNEISSVKNNFDNFLAATKQLYEWFIPSVHLSLCPSVNTFWQCSCHHIITKFSGMITTDKSNVRAKGQGQKSKVNVTEVKTQLPRFQTITPVWIHIW